MFRRICLVSVALLAANSLMAATDPFIGDWKLDPDKSKMSDVMRVEHLDADKWTFNFGSFPETIAVDGTDQPGIFGTTLAVSPQAPDKWKVVRKKDDHLLLIGIWSLSADGSTLSDDFTSFRSDGTTGNVKYIYKRSGSGSGFAATWIGAPTAMTSPLVLQIRPFENGLSLADSKGQDICSLRFDGKDYPHSGAVAVSGYVSSGRRTADNAIELTDKVGSSQLRTRQLELSPDLNTLTIIIRNGRSTDPPNIQVFERQ